MSEPEEGWIGENVECDLCGHKWIAVYHEDSERLQCPNCYNMVHFEQKGI